jgi:hypothetical protein
MGVLLEMSFLFFPIKHRYGRDMGYSWKCTSHEHSDIKSKKMTYCRKIELLAIDCSKGRQVLRI